MSKKTGMQMRVFPGSLICFVVIMGLILAINLQSRSGNGIFSRESRAEILYFAETPEEILEISRQFFPEYRSKRANEQHLVHFFGSAKAVLAYDVQAMPLLERDANIYFYPLYEDVIGFEADSGIAQEMTSWESLLASNQPICLGEREPEQRYIWMNIAYALTGRLDKKAAVDFLAKKFQAGELFLGQPAEINLVFHSHSVKSQEQKRQFIFPKEGSFAFRLGLLSHVPLPEEAIASLRNAYRSLGYLPLSEKTDVAAAKRIYLAPDNIEEMQRFGSIQTALIRNILQRRKYAPTNGVEHHAVSLFLIVLISIGISSIYKAVIHAGVGNGIGGIGLTLIGFMMVTVLKYSYDGSVTINRALWYSLYFFILILPPCTLYISANINHWDRRVFPGWLKVAWGISFLLLLMVITNDYHQFAFRFLTEDRALWTTNYKRYWGYYLIAFWVLLTQAGSLGYLAWKSWDSPKRSRAFLPMAVIGLGILYSVMYNLHVPFFHEISLSLAMAGLGILFWGSILFGTLIPCNYGYKELFESSRLQMQILDEENVMQFQSGSQGRSNGDGEKAASFDCSDADYLVWSTAIHGGQIVTRENICELNALKKSLENIVRRLEKENQILKQKEQVKSQLVFVKEQNGLTEYVNVIVENKIKKMMDLLKKRRKNPQEEKNDLVQLQRMAFYCKRRCELLIKSKQKELCEISTMCRLIDEVNAVSSQEYSFFYGLEEGVSFKMATEIYECYHLFCELAMEEKIISMTSRLLKEAEDDGIYLYFLAEGNGEQLWKRVALNLTSSEVISYKNLGDAFSLVIHLKEGEIYDRFV